MRPYLLLAFLFLVRPVSSELLPTVKPLHYFVRLNFTNHFGTELRNVDVFKGYVSIEVEVTKNTTSFVLNAWKMDFHSTSVTCAGESIRVSEVIHHRLIDDTMTLHFVKLIQKGQKCVVSIQYSALFSELYGLYKSYFPSKFESNSKFVSIVTHNEPEMNRLWVPCIDRLDLLAEWTIEIEHPKDTRVLAMERVYSRPNGNRSITKIHSDRAIQAARVAFSVIQTKHFKSYSIKSNRGTTLRFWLPRNLTYKMRANEFLEISRQSFDQLANTFNYSLDCNVIEIVSVQHRTGISSGCLIVVDSRRDFDVRQLRNLLARLWLGSVVRYQGVEDAWFTHSLSEYLSLSMENFTGELRTQILHDTVYNNWILEEPLVRGVAGAWNSVHMYKNKGVMVISMIASVMGKNFKIMLKDLLERYEYSFFSRHRIFNLLREYTEKEDWPACFRAFLGTQMDFVGLPVVYVNRLNETKTTLSQLNYEIQNRTDPRYRDWFFTSQWTIPIFYRPQNYSDMKWMHHDEESLEISHEFGDSILIDPEAKCLMLIEYGELDDLHILWNNSLDCSLFGRYCLEPMFNKNFCQEVYRKNCPKKFYPPTVIYQGRRHRWDDEF